MAEERYRAPRVAITRVYTKKGDAGETGLVGGQRVRKDDPRIVAYGTVDELNAFIGAARQTLSKHSELTSLSEVLLRVQHELFNLGSVLATRPEDLRPQQARIGARDIDALEADMDQKNEELTALRSFVLPGGCRANTDLHVARTVCRRAERACVALAAKEPVDGEAIAYLNRLSDSLFVWSRWVSAKLGCEETLWDPNVAASATDSPPAPFRGT